MCVSVSVSRSAKEAEEKIKKALDKGEVLPTEARFDSNCITPGNKTLFLHKVKASSEVIHIIIRVFSGLYMSLQHISRTSQKMYNKEEKTYIAATGL